MENSFYFSIIDRFEAKEQFYPQVVLLFTVNGEAEVVQPDSTVRLAREDFMIINSSRRFRVRSGVDGAAVAMLRISTSLLRKQSGSGRLHFRCCSAAENGSKYDKFRFLISNFLGECYISPDRESFMKLSSFYRLCSYMLEYFEDSPSRAEVSLKKDERLEEILSYIEDNWNRELSLTETADRFYLTPSAFTHYFKRSLGIPFIEYVNRVRLNYAQEEMLASDRSITQIAMDCGFSSAAAFNKVFRRYFDMSPRQYRNRTSADGSPTGNTGAGKQTAQPAQTAERKYLTAYNSISRLTVVREEHARLLTVEADTGRHEPAENPWKSMLHLGRVSNLLAAQFQAQIKSVHNELKFTYGIVSGLLSDELRLRLGHQDAGFNFSMLDTALSVLVSEGIRPYLSFDNQSTILVRDYDVNGEEEYQQPFLTLEEAEHFFGELMRHLVYYFGQDEVRTWRIQFWYGIRENGLLGIHGDFAGIWDRLIRVIRNEVPDIQTGAGGAPPSLPEERMERFFSSFGKVKVRPDFLVFDAYPYSQATIDTENWDRVTVRRRTDGFMAEDLRKCRRVMEKTGFGDLPLFLYQWNLSFVVRNPFNDTAGKAAMMLHHMTDAMDLVDEAAYWQAGDYDSIGYDAPELMNGACGLMTADGIPKAAYYALLFFSELYGEVIERGEHYIITTDGRDRYRILLFNSKQHGYSYYAVSEAELKAEELDRIYTDQDDLEITLKLEGLHKDRYDLQQELVGPGRGDLQSAWFELGREHPMTGNDVRYLRAVSVPQRHNDTVSTEKGKLVIYQRLRAHEMMLLRLF